MEKGDLFLKHGLDLLVYNLISLVDRGYSEDINIIENHMYNEDLLQYIFNKYQEEGEFEMFTTGTYSINDVNKYVCGMASYVNGNESRKYGICNNGLLLIASVCFGLGNDMIKKIESIK